MTPRPSSRLLLLTALALAAVLSGCSKHPNQPAPTDQSAATQPTEQPAPPSTGPVEPQGPIFHVDPATAGSVSGTVRMTGPHPAGKPIDMSEDPACVKAHKGTARDESLVVNNHGDVDDAFVYIKSGLEGKTFEVPQAPVVLDQSGCWFHPRVLGIQVGQVLQVVNSDPVTHNIHPEAVINREWNHSQGPGDPPLIRRFTKPEVMIPVKCNIHSWMHAFFGVLPYPYFAVTKPDGAFTIPNLPPGTYTLAIWQQKLGTEEQQITVPAHGNAKVNILFKGK